MNDELPFTLPFIRWANVAVLTNWTVHERRLYDHELVYVMAGRGHIVIEGQKYSAEPDRLFLIQPRVRHSFQPQQSKSLHLLGVHFDWSPQHDTLAFPIYRPATEPVEEGKFRAAREIPNWSLRKQPFLNLRGQLQVRRAFEAVVAEYSRGDEEARNAAGALLCAAMFTISRAAREQNYRARRIAVGVDALHRAEQARELLESQPEAPRSVEDVARQVGWSADHLRRVFRQIWNISPSQIQFDVRMQHARDLLRQNDISVAEVGQRCGFEDASHFSRVFKSHLGLTPRQYLRLSKKL